MEVNLYTVVGKEKGRKGEREAGREGGREGGEGENEVGKIKN